MIRVAIIDSTCRLSALPSLHDFQTLDYVTKGNALIECEVSESLVEEIWKHRDIAYVLPLNTPKPALLDGAFVLNLDLSLNPPLMTLA